MFKQAGLPDYSRISMEALGSEHSYGPHSRALESREVILRLVATHKSKKALDNILAKEITPAALSMAPGITGGVRTILGLMFQVPFIIVSQELH